MNNFTPVSAIIGGALIGLSAVWLMAFNGRIAGISGIFGGIFDFNSSKTQAQRQSELGWRLAFFAGLILSPFILTLMRPELGYSNFPMKGTGLVIAGILVGWGTQLDHGCTSGHGVCGIARLSPRSIVATLIFMLTGMVTVFLARYLGAYS